jgi:hypothetical protein
VDYGCTTTGPRGERALPHALRAQESVLQSCSLGAAFRLQVVVDFLVAVSSIESGSMKGFVGLARRTTRGSQEPLGPFAL